MSDIEEDILKEFWNNVGKDLFKLREEQFAAVKTLQEYSELPTKIDSCRFKYSGMKNASTYVTGRNATWADRIVEQKLKEAIVEIQAMCRTIIGFEGEDLQEPEVIEARSVEEKAEEDLQKALDSLENYHAVKTRGQSTSDQELFREAISKLRVEPRF